jgi:hypothetical protein
MNSAHPLVEKEMVELSDQEFVSKQVRPTVDFDKLDSVSESHPCDNCDMCKDEKHEMCATLMCLLAFQPLGRF